MEKSKLRRRRLRNKEKIWRNNRPHIWLGRIVIGVILLGLWEGLSGHAFKILWVSKPSLIFIRLVQMIGNGQLWYHLSVTLEEMLIGLPIGLLAGILLGILLAYSGYFQHYVSPYIMALYSLPRVALAPLFVVWFGIGLQSKVFMVVIMVIFISYYNAYEGIRNIDPDLEQMMRSYQAGRWQKLKWLILPSAAPWILNSVRLSIGASAIGAVIAEMVGANRGLGYFITYSSSILDTTGVFSGLLVIMMIAVVLERLLVLVEKYIFRYR
ncbi:MAG: ABC transporter permease [Sporolactobacillus sp.]|jgi:NitT/TauT family transport system permease protein|nr:ABC transporter permease [Sporolactobacillus sp.]MCI1881117.1 ABC transporter permease [Sporolactobacillus sp.]